MRNPFRLSRHFAACLLIAGLLAACGSKDNTTTITSSTVPSVFYSHAAALKNDGSGTIYTWGANFFGQLGNNDSTGTFKNTPTENIFIIGLLGVSVGGTHTMALKNDGSVYAWGNNGFGQLGNGSQIISFAPSKVTFSSGTIITAIAAGGSHSLALDQSGQVWAWGDDSYGQLGSSQGSTPDALKLTPASVLLDGTIAPLTHITKIAAGGDHSLAVDSSTYAYSWGANNTGQLGFRQYSTTSRSLRAIPVYKADGSLLSNVTDISAGGGHSLFLTGDGNVWGCGYNAYGQLGLGDNTDRHTGVVKISFTGVTIKQVAAGLDHSLALDANGNVWAWGYNFYGQLGNGGTLATITSLQTTPVQVLRTLPDGSHAQLGNIKTIIAVGDSSYAVDNAGYLWAWGDNTFGQLGLGDQTNRNYATKLDSAGAIFDLYHP